MCGLKLPKSLSTEEEEETSTADLASWLGSLQCCIWKKLCLSKDKGTPLLRFLYALPGDPGQFSSNT